MQRDLRLAAETAVQRNMKRRGKNRSLGDLKEELCSPMGSLGGGELSSETMSRDLARLRNIAPNAHLVHKIIQILRSMQSLLNPLILRELNLNLERVAEQMLNLRSLHSSSQQSACALEEQIIRISKQKKKQETFIQQIKEESHNLALQVQKMHAEIELLKERQKELIEFIVSNNLKKVPIQNNNNSKSTNKLNTHNYKQEYTETSSQFCESLASEMSSCTQKPVKDYGHKSWNNAGAPNPGPHARTKMHHHNK